MEPPAQPTASHGPSIGHRLGDALFIAGIVAAVVVLGPFYAASALLRRIRTRAGAGLRAALHRPATLG